MIGDYQPVKHRPDPVLVVLAILATIAALVLLVTYQPGADQPSTSCDIMVAQTQECP